MKVVHGDENIDTISEILENPEMSIEDKIDYLGQELMSHSLAVIIRLRRGGKKPSKAENEKQEEIQRQFKLLQKMYVDLNKMNRVGKDAGSGKNATFSKEILDRIKSKKSTMSPIVTRINEANG